jgi:uncharacterized membrane protein YgcG
MRLRLPRRWLLLGAVVGLGCYSPTLPLPPPVKPDISQTDMGTYRLHGGVVPDAIVFVLNQRTSLIDGQQADAAGIYDFELHSAQADDVMFIWYEAGTDLSPTTTFALPDFSTKNGGGGSSGSGGTSGSGGSAGMDGASGGGG